MTRGVAGSGLMLAGLFLAFLAALAPGPAGAGAASATPGRPVWSGASRAVSTSGASDRSGELVFRTKGCAACHSISARGFRALVSGPPDLSDARDFGTRRSGLSAEGYIAESIREPLAFIAPGDAGLFAMPSLGLSDVEIVAVTRFILGR